MKWEYLVESLYEWDETEVRRMLVECGKLGWELVHVSDSLRTYFFKRPIN